MYYIKIPQEVTNENAIKCVFITLAQYKTRANASCNTTDRLINAHLYN